jgi:hypothetical protein
MCVASVYEFDTRPPREHSASMLKRAGCGSHHSIVASGKLLMEFFGGQLRTQNCGVPPAKPVGDR